MMPVNVVEHLLSRMQQRVQGTDALMRNDNTAVAMNIGMDAQRPLQAGHIYAAIGHVAGPCIAGQVIQLIYIQRPT